MKVRISLRQHVFIFSFVILVMVTAFFLNDVSTVGRNAPSSSKSIKQYISQLRGLAQYTGNKRTGATSVLILTYMRSGSSLTGDILQQAKESFYMYEPLWMFRSGINTAGIPYVNGSKRLYPVDEEAEKNDLIYNIFTCQIGKWPVRAFSAGFMGFGKKSKQVKSCMSRYRYKPYSEKLTLCGRDLEEACLNSPVRIIKTIRMELESVSHLLDMLPNMKIVHLVRDPRATLASQRRLGRCSVKLNGTQGCTQSFCKRLENDVLEEEKLQQLHPGRVQPIFYEDIARHPIETAQKMYDFIGTTFTPEANAYVFNITMAGKNDSCVICTTRSNSTEHIDTWKSTMGMDFVNLVQERCNYILKRYGFEII